MTPQTLIAQSERLNDALYEAWRAEPRGTRRAAQLVHVAARAHRRLWRRKAAAGDQQHIEWVARLSATIMQRGAA